MREVKGPNMKLLTSAAALCTALMFIPFAVAQDASSQWGISASKDVSYADIGLAGLSRLNYLGSDESVTDIYPYIDAEYRGRFYIKPSLGAGVYLINNENFRINLGGNYAFGRDAETFNGVTAQSIDDAITASLGARVITRFGAIEAQMAVPVSGDMDGEHVDMAYIVQFDPTPALRINPGARISLWSEDRINQFYAVPASTKFGSFGFKGNGAQSGSVFVAAYWQFAQDYEFVGVADYARLFGDIPDSPLSVKDDGLTLSVALARKF